MPRKSQFDQVRLSRILTEQHHVISRAQALACGMSPRALHLRTASTGPWRRILPEADFRVLIRPGGLPMPVFNAQLFDADGTFIATADAWWQEAGVAAEVDSRAYHLAAEDQDRTSERHDKLTALGIFVLHFSPKRIRKDAPGVIKEIRQAIENGLQRPPLAIKGLPPIG